MEPEPSLGALLKAIQALTNQVRSSRTKSNPKASKLTQLVAICKETNNLVGDKDLGGGQAKPGPLSGPVTPPTWEGRLPHSRNS
ncbi:hypothetical protein RHS01_07513 [Rhizoctonia solani]|uniref:Uncharacterized protein n=1 Tax=Rhizoctonia solani TaxID=456999 RepID=A0A8H7ICM9_9AGAM|nr:hypothetical protein RHS01_07513 [Rhizoctonia solani]